VSSAIHPSEATPAIRIGSGKLLLGVRVCPSAPRTTLRGVYGDRLKVSVSAPPEDDRANSELTDALAGWLSLRRDSVDVEAGRGSRDKVVAISGLEEAELRNKLAGLLQEARPRMGE
jgi:uncharacterized protein (TIGR00251 family)